MCVCVCVCVCVWAWLHPREAVACLGHAAHTWPPMWTDHGRYHSPAHRDYQGRPCKAAVYLQLEERLAASTQMAPVLCLLWLQSLGGGGGAACWSHCVVRPTPRTSSLQPPLPDPLPCSIYNPRRLSFIPNNMLLLLVQGTFVYKDHNIAHFLLVLLLPYFKPNQSFTCCSLIMFI